MIELWAKIQIWSEYIIPIAILVITVLIYIVACMVTSFKWGRKIKWLEAHGFERYLRSVSSVGGSNSYGWKEKEGGRNIAEYELRGLTFREFRRRMEK